MCIRDRHEADHIHEVFGTAVKLDHFVGRETVRARDVVEIGTNVAAVAHGNLDDARCAELLYVEAGKSFAEEAHHAFVWRRVAPTRGGAGIIVHDDTAVSYTHLTLPT